MLYNQKYNKNKTDNIDKNFLEILYNKTEEFFYIKDGKKHCKSCRKIVSNFSPRCIDCWLNNQSYYSLLEKIIFDEKKKYFQNLYDKLLSQFKNYNQFTCYCNLDCKEIIKNEKKYLICCKKKCDYFKFHPINYAEEIQFVLRKIKETNFNFKIVPTFPFSESQKK